MTEASATGGLSSITRRRFADPEDAITYEHGTSAIVRLGREFVWRSELQPGWSWDTDLKPLADGAPHCPRTHREYVQAGQVRYLMLDGTEVRASAGDVLFIPPGHRSWVEGDETCILIDW
jgi:AraC-like ligand binding domain